MQALAEPKLSGSNGTQTPLLFLPVPACATARDESNASKIRERSSNETNLADVGEGDSSPVSYDSILIVLSDLTVSGYSTASPTLSSYVRSPTGGVRETDDCVEALQVMDAVGAASLHCCYLLAGVGAAYSADALTLSQILITSMVSVTAYSHCFTANPSFRL